MNKREAFIIFKKELTVILRDRRTLFLAFLLPVIIYPFLIFGIAKIRSIGEKKLEKREAVIAVEDDTFTTASKIDNLIVKIRPGETRKIKVIEELIEKYVDIDRVIDLCKKYETTVSP